MAFFFKPSRLLPGPHVLRLSQTLNVFSLQLAATDVSAQTPMKGAAKCDKHCEMQNSANQQNLERILRCRVIPCSVPSSVSTRHVYNNPPVRRDCWKHTCVTTQREPHVLSHMSDGSVRITTHARTRAISSGERTRTPALKRCATIPGMKLGEQTR